MSNKVFIKFSAFYFIFLIFLIFLILLFLNFINLRSFSSFVYSIIIAFTNFLIGYFSINYGINKKDKSFLLIVFGAIIIRFFIVFFMIIGVLSFLDVRTDYFIFTTFILYFYYLVVEILYLKNLKNVEKIKE